MPLSRRSLLKCFPATLLLTWWRSLSAGLVNLDTDIETILAVFVDTLIPKDGTPSATELGVDQKILQKGNDFPRYRKFIVSGCTWLDTVAKEINGGDFISLTEAERDQILAKASRSERRSLPRRFFDIVRSDAFSFYYSRSESWQGLDYAGPPQPNGYIDHNLPPESSRALQVRK